MDTWLTEHFTFAFLPSQPPVLPLSPPVLFSEPLGIIGKSGACWEAVWGAFSWLVSREEEGGTWLCCSSRPLLPAISPWCFQVF